VQIKIEVFEFICANKCTVCKGKCKMKSLRGC
jgi:hypothetical protein